METRRNILIVFLLLGSMCSSSFLRAQEPDLSKISGTNEKIKAWIAYCESLRSNKTGKNNFPALQQAALAGIAMTPATDPSNRARFYFLKLSPVITR
jgi:hypothetical protein